MGLPVAESDDGFGRSADSESEPDHSDLPADARLHPGILSVAGAAPLGDTWFILDQLGYRVHRVGPDGELMGEFGRQGEGPGELIFPEALAVHGDTIVVADQGVLRLYNPEGDHIADRNLGVRGCATSIPTVLDIASAKTGILVLLHCTGGNVEPLV